MIKPSGTGCITLAELDTFVAGDLVRQMHVGESVVLQQPDESLDALVGRVRRSARVLRESGCRISSTRFLLGAHRADRLAERLELARSLLGLSADSSSTLQLISTAETNEQERLFELVGWLLIESQHTQRIHLTFREQKPVTCAIGSRQELSTDADGQVFDLTA